MNRSITILFCLVTVFSVVPPSYGAGDPFDGAWSWADRRDSFELYLAQDGAKIKGTHAATHDLGRRSDTQEEPETAGPSVRGKVTGGVAEVSITSAYSGKIGTARIAVTPAGLRWTVLKAPDGEFYFPLQALLKRSKVKVPKIADEPDAITKSLTAAALGHEAFSKGKFSEAVAAFDQALHFDPSNSSVIEGKADAYIKQKQFAQASSLYSDALKCRPNDSELLLKRAECNLNLLRYDQAVVDLTEAIEIDEAVKDKGRAIYYRLLSCYRNRANAYSELGKLDLAEPDRLKADSVKALLIKRDQSGRW